MFEPANMIRPFERSMLAVRRAAARDSIWIILLMVCLNCPTEVRAWVPQTTPQVIFEANFDDTLLSTENESPLMSSGLDFQSGVSGKGVLIESGDVLQYPVSGNISPLEGSISLWVKPNWNPGDILYRVLVLGKEPRNFEVHIDEGKRLAFSVNTWQLEGKPIKVAFAEVDYWRANTWYFLTFTWSSTEIAIYINGKKAGGETVGFDIPIMPGNDFHLGSLDGQEAFNGVMD